LCNFLALLGWSSQDGTEFFSREELIEAFDLSRINRHNSVFNYVPGDPKNWTDPKAIHFNASYIRSMPLDELVVYVKKELENNDLWKVSYESIEKEWFLNSIDLIRTRFLLVTDFSTRGRYCFSDEFDYDPKAVKKNLCQDSRLTEYLPELAQALDDLPEFKIENVEEVFRDFALKKDVKAGLLINAARTAVSGSSVGPGLFEMLVMLGKKAVVTRLKESLSIIAKHS